MGGCPESAASSELAVSVIVPVRDRVRMLGDLLAGLDLQTFRSFEVLVVDDGSTDGSGDLAGARTVVGRPVRVLNAGGNGAVRARELGVTESQGDILAFTDSDCVPDPAWLDCAMAAFGDGADAVNGATRPMRPLRPFERSMESGREGLYPTCNVLYRRELFERLGGFDAEAAFRWRFRLTKRAQGLGFGEDTLLGWQAIRSGADVRFVPDAIVEHQVFPRDLRDFSSRIAQVAAFPAMIKEIPELRETLMEDGVFLGNHARVPLYVILVAMLARRRRLAALALGWWALSRLDSLRRSPYSAAEQLPWLPAEMLSDVAYATGLVAGSIQARSIVL
jgi:glycosyltransferase involved in cell wall biosynthesis